MPHAGAAEWQGGWKKTELFQGMAALNPFLQVQLAFLGSNLSQEGGEVERP